MNNDNKPIDNGLVNSFNLAACLGCFQTVYGLIDKDKSVENKEGREEEEENGEGFVNIANNNNEDKGNKREEDSFGGHPNTDLDDQSIISNDSSDGHLAQVPLQPQPVCSLCFKTKP